MAGLNVSRGMYGALGAVNLWSFEMTVDDISDISTASRGNIVNKDTVQMYGSPNTTEIDITSYQKFGKYGNLIIFL